MNNIPEEFQKYFWDTNITKIDQEKHQTYIIERLADHGDLQAFKWLKDNYSKEKIKEIALKSRRVSERTKNFLQLIY